MWDLVPGAEIKPVCAALRLQSLSHWNTCLTVVYKKSFSIDFISLTLLSCFCCVRLFVTLWTVTHQAFLSIGFSRKEYWSGLPCGPPGDLPDSGIEPTFLMFPALAGRFWWASNFGHYGLTKHL